MISFLHIENMNGIVVDSIWKLTKELFNQPRWLQRLLVITIVVGCIYFSWNWYSEQDNIDKLREEVEMINSRLGTNITGDEYSRHLKLIISELRYIKYQHETKHEEQVLQLQLLIRYIEKYHPEDPLLDDFNNFVGRLKINNEFDDRYYNYALEQLESIINERELKIEKSNSKFFDSDK